MTDPTQSNLKQENAVDTWSSGKAVWYARTVCSLKQHNWICVYSKTTSLKLFQSQRCEKLFIKESKKNKKSGLVASIRSSYAFQCMKNWGKKNIYMYRIKIRRAKPWTNQLIN